MFPYKVKSWTADYSHIYPEEFIKNICEKLNNSNLSEDEITDIIFSITDDYMDSSRDRKSSFTHNEAISKINSFVKSQKKALIKFEELSTDPLLSMMFTLKQRDSLEESLSDNRHKKVSKTDFIETVSIAIGTLKEITEDANGSERYFGIPTYQALREWLINIEVLFDHSPVNFVQPKYDNELGYQSECLNILFELMKPLDLEVEEQQIAEQIKIIKSKEFQST
jgi:hypothetical protein